MVSVYCRVSTKGQQKDGHSLDTQEERGREFAIRLGEDCTVYREAKSGKRLDNRDEWHRLVEDVDGGHVRAVWIIDGDRLARKLSDSIGMVEYLDEAGVELYVGDRLVDAKDPDSVMLFQITQAVAQRNGDDIIRKSVRGIRAGIRKGTRAANKLYGYQRKFDLVTGKSKWVEHREQGESIRLMFKLYIEGMSIKKITKELNRLGYRNWATYHGVTQDHEGNPINPYISATHVNRTLKNPRYCGLAYSEPGLRGELVPCKVYPPLIDEETWRKAHELVNLNSSRSFKKGSDHMSSGILRCGTCGAPYHFHTHNSGGARRYRTYDHHQEGPKECPQRPVTLREAFVDPVLSCVGLITFQDRGAAELLFERERTRIKKTERSVARSTDRIHMRREELGKEKRRLVQAIRKGIIEEADIRSEMRKINSELSELQSTLDELTADLSESKEKYDALLGRFAAESFLKFADAEPRLKRNMLRSVVSTATITGREIEIRTVTGKSYEVTYPTHDRNDECVEEFLIRYTEQLDNSPEFEAVFHKSLDELESVAGA